MTATLIEHVEAVALSFGLAFVLSMSVALLYVYLHRRLPYSRSFAQALAVAGVVSALTVLAIGDSIARGIGLVGALTVVRFRSNLKDPRDLIFAFAALGSGVAAGAHAYTVGVLGTLLFIAATTLVSGRWFGREQDDFDAVLSLQAPSTPSAHDALAAALRSGCDGFSLIRLRQADDGMQEHAYHVRLRDPQAQLALFRSLEQVHGIESAQLLAYDAGDGM